MSAIDPRIARRRHVVAEHGARRRLRAMLWVTVLAVVIGLAWWATQSELLDIDTIAIGPTTRVDVGGELTNAGISEGSSLVSAIIASRAIESSLEENPWVRAATVNVLFPGTIEIEVVERTAVAVVATGDGGWSLAAADLVVLEPVTAPPEELGVIASPSLFEEGMVFLGAMGDLAGGTRLSLVDGEVWVDRAGVRARLGRAIDMEAKAAALRALLAEDIPEGWGINLVAPSRPALFEIAQP